MEEKKTLKEQFAAFKAELADLFNTTSRFKDFKAEDGTIIRCDTETIQKGSKLEAMDEKGNLFPLPDGKYKIEGQSFTVESGFVKEMEAAQSTDPVAQAGAGTAAKPAGDVAALAEIVKGLQAEIEAIKSQLGGAKPSEEMQNEINKAQEPIISRMSAIEKENETLKETFKKFFSIVEEIANQTDEPTAKPKDQFYRDRVVTTDDKVAEFREKNKSILGI